MKSRTRKNLIIAGELAIILFMILLLAGSVYFAVVFVQTILAD